MSLLGALKWTFLSEIASKAIQPAVFVVLARLLTPEDYGVMASAAMVISFSQIFWEAGMAKALIQYQGDRIAAANVAFWINIVLGLVVAGVLVAIAGPVAEHIFHDSRVSPVLRVMAFQIFLSASVSVHVALLQKDLRFKHLFWVRLATVALPGMASIPLAWQGYGYWSLVAGNIVGQLFQVGLLWRTSPWRPRAVFDQSVARHLGRFGGWVALSGLLAWFYGWADSLIVGLYLGTHDLGLYRTGNVFVTMIYGFLFGPLMPVLYSHLSVIQADRERVRQTLFKTIKILTLIAIPIAILVYANSQFIADVVFGDRWQGVELVIGVLALMHGYSWVVGANGEAYRAVGAPSYETIIMIITLLFYGIGYWLSIQKGFEVFLWTRLYMAIAACSVHLFMAKKVLNQAILPTVKYVIKISLVCIPALILGYLFRYEDYEGLSYHAASLLCGAMMILFALMLLERDEFIKQLRIRTKRGLAR